MMNAANNENRSGSAESHRRLATSVARLLRADFRRFGIDPADLKRALLDRDWLVGYVAGACLVRLEAVDDAPTRRLVDLTGRVCAELMGGGPGHKALAFQRVRDCMGSREFMLGSADAQRAWGEDSLRAVLT